MRPAPAKPTGAGMVVIPDVRGLHPYYKELAERFAEIGVDAVAIDFFARTATPRTAGRVRLHVPRAADQAGDAPGRHRGRRGAPAHPDGGAVRSLFSVGFCFGGALSYLQAASGLGYAGVIGFYGWPLGLKRWPDRPRPIDAVGRYTCPVLSIFGGADQGIPQSAIDEFDGGAAARPESSTTPPSIPARPTASSTASRPSSRRPPPTPGSACRPSWARTPSTDGHGRSGRRTPSPPRSGRPVRVRSISMATTPSALRLRQRVAVSARSRAIELPPNLQRYAETGERLVAEPFRGVTADGAPAPGLFADPEDRRLHAAPPGRRRGVPGRARRRSSGRGRVFTIDERRLAPLEQHPSATSCATGCRSTS